MAVISLPKQAARVLIAVRVTVPIFQASIFVFFPSVSGTISIHLVQMSRVHDARSPSAELHQYHPETYSRLSGRVQNDEG